MKLALGILATLALFVGSASANMLVNGDFENNLAGWQAPDGNVVLDGYAPAAGSRAAMIIGIPDPVGVDVRLFQEISLTAGTTYTLSGKYRIDRAKDANNWRPVSIGFFQTADFNGSLAQFTDTASAAKGWTDFSIQYTPATSGNAFVLASVWKSAAIMSVDSLTVVPEPATLSVLALGGLTLIRRRRA